MQPILASSKFEALFICQKSQVQVRFMTPTGPVLFGFAVFIFSFRTGDCEHPDVADRQGCTAEELYGFACPSTVGQGR